MISWLEVWGEILQFYKKQKQKNRSSYQWWANYAKQILSLNYLKSTFTRHFIRYTLLVPFLTPIVLRTAAIPPSTNAGADIIRPGHIFGTFYTSQEWHLLWCIGDATSAAVVHLRPHLKRRAFTLVISSSCWHVCSVMISLSFKPTNTNVWLLATG